MGVDTKALREKYAPRERQDGYEDQDGVWHPLPSSTVRVVGWRDVLPLCDEVEKLREALRAAPVPLVGSTTPEYIEWFRNKRRAALSEGES